MSNYRKENQRVPVPGKGSFWHEVRKRSCGVGIIRGDFGRDTADGDS